MSALNCLLEKQGDTIWITCPCVRLTRWLPGDRERERESTTTTSLSTVTRFCRLGDRSIDELDMLDIDTLRSPSDLSPGLRLDGPLLDAIAGCVPSNFFSASTHTHTKTPSTNVNKKNDTVHTIRSININIHIR